MRGRFVALLLCVSLCSVLAQLDIQAPRVVGNAGYGYTFSLNDGNGNLILASNPAGDNPTVIMKSPISSQSGLSGQILLSKSRGRVTCGCLVSLNATHQILYAGLSVPGYAVRIDLDFPEEGAVKYLNATDEAVLWNSGPPQTFVSAVCKGDYVYFGTKGDRVSATIARLDTTNTDPLTRFQTLGPIAPGDLTFGTLWGSSELLFAMEPDGEAPLSFITITSGSNWKFESITPVSPVLSSFEMLSGMIADSDSKRVVVTNAVGTGRAAVIDLSKVSAATVEQELDLSEVKQNPITTFVADTEARVLYLTLGTCASATDIAFVAVRLAPELAILASREVDPKVHDCTKTGLPRQAVLVKSVNDTFTAPATRRRVIVATEVDFQAGKPVTDGVIFDVVGFGAGPCVDHCHESEGHGECVAEKCFCYRAWSGAACNVSEPCKGTNCSSKGNCINNKCVCNSGWLGEDCSTPVPCPLSCSNQGSCVLGVCQCSAGFSGESCEFQSVGCERLQSCNGHGACQSGYPSGTCLCTSGYSGDDCSVMDSSCPNNCSSHGTCLSGACVCQQSWTGSDCSTEYSPCPHNCSSNGVCRFEKCTCFHGYKGLDCSILDHSYCMFGCSEHGQCSDGVCVCEPGWKGVDCTTVVTDLAVTASTILRDGENAATTAFTVTISANEIVFCVASVPGKCIGLNSDSLLRVRDASFIDLPTAMLLQDSEGRDLEIKSDSNALMPDFTSITSVSLVQVGAVIGDAPISVSVVEDTPSGFAILGTALPSGAMHGQLIKISTATLARMTELELDDDNGRGITAGCNGHDDTFFFAAGASPAMIYRVNAQLEILSRITVNSGEISSLMYDGSAFLVATSKSSVYIFRTNGVAIEAWSTPSVQLAATLGDITAGFIDNRSPQPIVYVGTNSAPAAVAKITLKSESADLQSFRFRAGEDKISCVTHKDDFAYFGLAVDGTGNTCYAIKVSLVDFSEVDTVDIKNCSANLISATMSADGDYAYFGNGASPAHIYAVRLFYRPSCPGNCSRHGVCVEGICKCNAGWAGDACMSVLPTCPRNCSRSGECVDGVCKCDLGHFGADCSNTEVCTDKCVHGHCTGANETWPCSCDSFVWAGRYCSEAVNYCPNQCSGHGLCDNGICNCDSNHEGFDCSGEKYPAQAARGCRLNSDCGTHGLCQVDTNGTGSCACDEGWTGADCDVTQEFHDSVAIKQPSAGISPAVIGVLVAVAIVVGMIAGVSIWKSWMGSQHVGGAGSSSNPSVAGLAGGPSKVMTSEGYTRLPRRLVK
eukprot:c2927_g1_i1.p1 GENE.c2927_g1_i1~~c2927_g1_i1.p1  ORF type:complete len:1281 (+),score=293.26 c2927_g1_i1:56-3898(+)